jgi:adenine phosphoribosyltransferase
MAGNETERIIRGKIRDFPDYPKKGVVFRDITPVLKDGPTFDLCIDELVEGFSAAEVDYVVGVEARGFIMGAALAYAMGAGFVPIRKKGKLPSAKVSAEYDLEYGTETIEMHSDAVELGSNVLIADDLLATGGTARAAADLVRGRGANVVGFAFLVELVGLKGAEKLGGGKIVSLVKY